MCTVVCTSVCTIFVPHIASYIFSFPAFAPTIFVPSQKHFRLNSFQVLPKFSPTNTKSPGRPHGSSPYRPPGLSHCVLLLALMLHSALDDLTQQLRPALAILHRQSHLARQLHKLVIVHLLQRIFPAQCTPFGAHLCVRRIFCSCPVFCIF